MSSMIRVAYATDPSCVLELDPATPAWPVHSMDISPLEREYDPEQARPLHTFNHLDVVDLMSGFERVGIAKTRWVVKKAEEKPK